jgi:hypothetical protein
MELYDPGESSTEDNDAESYINELQLLTEAINYSMDQYFEVANSCFRSDDIKEDCKKYLNKTLLLLNKFELPDKIIHFTVPQKKIIIEILLKLLNSHEVMQHFLKKNDPILPSSVKNLKIIIRKLYEIRANIIAKLNYIDKTPTYVEEDTEDYYNKYYNYNENLPLTDDSLPTGGRSRKYKKKTVRRKTIRRKAKTRKIIRRKTKTRKTKRY